MKGRPSQWTKIDEAVGSKVSDMQLEDAVLFIAKIFGRESRGENRRLEILSAFNHQSLLDASMLIELGYPRATVYNNFNLFKKLGLIERAAIYQRLGGGRMTTVWKLKE